MTNTELCLLSEIEGKDREIQNLKKKIKELEERISNYGWERDAARQRDEENWSSVWR